MSPRLVGLSLAAVLVIAAAGTSLAGTASSADVTVDQGCNYPLDLQVNQLDDVSDAYVWLKRLTEEQVYDLVWTLWQGGFQVGDGDFDVVECWTSHGKYILVYPGFFSDGATTGTFTVKVDWNNGVNYSGDSFSVD